MESNLLSRGSLEKGGAKLTKTYRLYDWENETSGLAPLSGRGASAVSPIQHSALVRYAGWAPPTNTQPIAVGNARPTLIHSLSR
jgi:hypothetical protein